MGSNQSRGLIMASKTRGWDPTVIPSGPNGGDASILPNFDKDRGNVYYGGAQVGSLPDGTPDGWPDGHDVMGVPSPAPESRDFAPAPQASGNENLRTKNANPYPGFGGEGY